MRHRPDTRQRLSRRTLLALPALVAAPVRRSSAAASDDSVPLCQAANRISLPPSLEHYMRFLTAAGDVFPSEKHAEEIEALLKLWSDALIRSHDATPIMAPAIAESLS